MANAEAKMARYYLMNGHMKKVTIGGKTYTKEMFDKEAGRNDICPCGSGKKFKKCCMKQGGN